MAKPRPEPTPPKGFVASAVSLPTVVRNMAGRSEGWQKIAWEFWESVGELRYPSTWIGNVMSGARLMAAKREGQALVPVVTGPAAEAMEALYGGPQGQAEMLQSFGVHLTVAGEGYLTNHDDDKWNVLASGKVTQTNDVVKADFGETGGSRELSPSDFVLRIWTPNPRDPTRADSPTRANLGTLAQIRNYDAHIDAQLSSRLAGAGILFLPSEIDFAVPPGADPAASQAENFMSVLGTAMLTPIKDRNNASAIVPIVVTMPGEHLEKPHLLHFWSELDENVVQMRDAAIKRLALGLDIPPEVLLGIADANHWNAWLSEESAIKSHLEPRLAVVNAALTTGYLRPAILGDVPDVEDYYVVADTSAIRLRPNRSQEAIELYNIGELSGAALRRETGFQPEDTPGSDEFQRWLLRKIATSGGAPDLTAAALAALGADLGLPGGGEGIVAPSDALRTDTIPQLPSRDLPSPEDSVQNPANRAAGLAAAAEVLLFRALERAGNKLRNGHPLTDAKAMAAHTVYMTLTGEPDYLLAGAWDCAPEVLAPYCASPSDVTSVIDVIDFYARGLLSSRRPPSSTVLATLLATRPTPVEV